MDAQGARAVILKEIRSRIESFEDAIKREAMRIAQKELMDLEAMIHRLGLDS